MVTPDAQGDGDRCEHGFTRAHYACPTQGETFGAERSGPEGDAGRTDDQAGDGG